MNNEDLPIGGEFWFNDTLQNKEENNNLRQQGILLLGGKEAIKYIIKDINLLNEDVVLLPSYLCPSIISIVEDMKVSYKLYEINEKLEININSIEYLINKNKVKAILFINYFGFYQSNEVRKYLCDLKKNGIIIIEDSVQGFWLKYQEKFIGNYIFNSYRKFLPVDGSLVICNKKDECEWVENSYSKIIKKARVTKTKFIFKGIGSEDKYLDLFNIANKEYYKVNDILGISKEDEEYLNHVPIEEIKLKRRENYLFLQENLISIPEINVIFDEKVSENIIPLAFPIYVKNRDIVRRELMKKRIYAPIHWDILNESWIRHFETSIEISRHILSLPIDWRYGEREMKYLLQSLKSILRR